MFSTELHVYVPMTSESLLTRLAQCHVYASCSVLMQMRFQGDLLKDQIHSSLNRNVASGDQSILVIYRRHSTLPVSDSVNLLLSDKQLLN